MKFILGNKVKMTQLFDEQGNVLPVTVIAAGPCQITQLKNQETDGYDAVQVGFGHKKNLSKALKGHLKGLVDFRYLREFTIDEKQLGSLKKGDLITAGTFAVGDKVKVVGISKGKGFQGVVRRHGFHGAPKTHGHKDQERMPGSIGPTAPARVFKGMRMPGHMGDDQVSVKNLEIVKIDELNNLIYLKGAVPGARQGLVELMAAGELKVNLEINNPANTDASKEESVNESVEKPTSQDQDKNIKTVEADKIKQNESDKVDQSNEDSQDKTVEAQPTEDKATNDNDDNQESNKENKE